jgi:hypothetical protein
MYSQILQGLPNWVLKGEYGDISNLLNNREQEFEKTRQAEQVNDLRDIALEEQQRKAELDERMREMDIFGGDSGKPPTLREMLEKQREVAMQYGGLDDVMGVQKQLEDLQDKQEQEDRAKLIQSRQDEEYEYNKQNRGKKGSGREESTIEMYNPETDDFGRVPASKVGDAKKLGYIDADHPRIAEIIAASQEAKDRAARESKKASETPWYKPWETAPPAPVSVTPTPAPGDQIKTIIRNRSSAVRGQ